MQMLSAIPAPVANLVSQGAQPAAAAEAAVDFGALLNGLQQETTPESTLPAELTPDAAGFWPGAVPDAGIHGSRKNLPDSSSDNDQSLSQILPAQARTNKKPAAPESAGDLTYGLFAAPAAPAPTAVLAEETAPTLGETGAPSQTHPPERQVLAMTGAENGHPAPGLAAAPQTTGETPSASDQAVPPTASSAPKLFGQDEAENLRSASADGEIRLQAVEPIAAPVSAMASAPIPDTTVPASAVAASAVAASAVAELRPDAANGTATAHRPPTSAAGAVAGPSVLQIQAADTIQTEASEGSGSAAQPAAPHPEGLAGSGSMPHGALVADLQADANSAATRITAPDPLSSAMTVMVNNPTTPPPPARTGARPSDLSETRFEQLLQVPCPEAAQTTAGPTATDLQPPPMFPESNAAQALMTEAASAQVPTAMEQELREATGSVVAASPRGDLAWPLPTDLRQADGPAPPREPVPTPSAGTPFMAEQQVLDQVVSRLSLRSFQGGQRLSMDLQPAELGQVHLELIQEQDRIQVRLLAQSSEVQGILERSLPQLQEALQQQGLRLDSIQVGLDQRHANAHGQQQFQGQFQQQASAHDQRRGSREQSMPHPQALAPIAAAANPSSTVSGLSLRI